VLGVGALAAACGLTDPDEDPDAALPLRSLSPTTLVSQELTVTAPDSGDGSAPAVLRFTLDPPAWTALGEGAVLELVVRTGSASILLEGWSAAAGNWMTLTPEAAGSGGNIDLWWRDAWITPALGTALSAGDRSVRIRLDGTADPVRTRLRILRPSSEVGLATAPGGPLTGDGDDVLLRDGITLRRRNSMTWAETTLLTSNSPSPDAFCRLGTHLYGVTAIEIWRVPLAGGSWQRVASLPWQGMHEGVALASDDEDLYLLRHPVEGTGEFPVLYRLDAAVLNGSSNFLAAVLDSNDVRRNNLTGGQGSPLLWWPDRRVLATPAVQEGSFGLTTFSRVGRGQHFIPLPFEEGPLQAAFVGVYLVVGSARPTSTALGWTDPLVPSIPTGGMLWRWRAP
jgi:hypothetical protein